MKTMFLSLLILSSTSVYASECNLSKMILAPTEKTAEACSELRAWGPATLNTCASTQQAELNIAAGGSYDLKATASGMVSKTEFQDDEDHSSFTTIFTLKTSEKTYDVQYIETDGRGHVKTQLSCAGRIQLQ